MKKNMTTSTSNVQAHELLVITLSSNMHIGIDEDSNQHLDLLSNWMCPNWHLLETFAHMR